MGAAKQGFIKGAMLLTVSTLLVKIIGAAYRIPITNIIGGEGIGYYSAAYNIYAPVYALCTAGMPIAIARTVSLAAQQGRFKDVKRMLNVCLGCFSLLGLLSAAAVLLFANKLVAVAGNEGALYPLMALSPAVFFCCIVAVFRGYNQGMNNMMPTATGLVIEAVVRAGAGLYLAFAARAYLLAGYAATGAVLGVHAATQEQALALAHPYMAAASIAGVALSELACALFMLGRHALAKPYFTKTQLAASPAAAPAFSLLKTVLQLAIPVSLSVLVINITSLIDLGFAMSRIKDAMATAPQQVLLSYKNLALFEKSAQQIPNFLYGCLQGPAATLVNFIPAVTSGLGISILPVIAAQWVAKNGAGLKRSVETVVKITALLAMPAGLGMCVLAKQILTMIYPHQYAEVAVAAPLLQVLSVAYIFVAICGPMVAVLQAIGRADLPLKLTLCASAIKLAVNYTLVAVPHINIKGATYGTLISYVFIAVALALSITKSTSVNFDFAGMLLKPFLCACACALSAKLTFMVAEKVLSQNISTLISVAVGVLIYAICLLVTKTIAKSEVEMLPNGKKMAQTLEKMKLVG